MTTWKVEWFANGEWQTAGRLTDEQIKAITKMIDALSEVNELLEDK
jgi:hypothetical protein